MLYVCCSYDRNRMGVQIIIFGVCFFFLALNFNVAKLKNCQILLFFVRPSAINNKPPKKKKQLDIKLDNSTSSFIPKIYGKNKREKECSDWKTIHNYFFSFS